MTTTTTRALANILRHADPGQVVEVHRGWCLTWSGMTDRCTCIPLELRTGATA